MEIQELINECITLEREKKRLLLTSIALFNPRLFRGFGLEISKKRLTELEEEFKGGVNEVTQKHRATKEGYDKKLSELAGIMDEEEFELDKFKVQLSQDQFLWLISSIKVIKEHLEGIEIL